MLLAWLSTHTIYAGKDTTVFIPKKNVVSLDILGKGITGSISYEYHWHANRKYVWSVQSGIGYWPQGTDGQFVPVPLFLNIIRKLGTRGWGIDAGVGTLFLPNLRPAPKADREEFKSQPQDYGRSLTFPFEAWAETSIGVRYQKEWTYRVFAVPIYGRSHTDLKYYGFVWGGISIGKAF